MLVWVKSELDFPTYMIPKFFPFLDILPKTWTNKIDYQKLKTSAKSWF